MSIANSPISTALYIDTHCHIDGEEFDEDREAVVQRAREAGVGKVFVPAIDLSLGYVEVNLIEGMKADEN